MRTPRYVDVIAAMRSVWLQHTAEFRFDMVVKVMGSPIEQVFLATMLAGGWESDFGREESLAARTTLEEVGLSQSDPRGFESNPQRLLTFYGGLPTCGTEVELSLDDRNIRIDFAFVFPGPHHTKIAVELDGHDFHERTPEQAMSDKSRDRKLQALGWHCLRFTGREVLQRPEQCLGEVENLLFAKSAIARAIARAEADCR